MDVIIILLKKYILKIKYFVDKFYVLFIFYIFYIWGIFIVFLFYEIVSVVLVWGFGIFEWVEDWVRERFWYEGGDVECVCVNR